MAGSGRGPRPAPSLAELVVVFVMEVVMLGDSREQEGRLEGQLVSGESDIELGTTGGPGRDPGRTLGGYWGASGWTLGEPWGCPRDPRKTIEDPEEFHCT